MKNLFLFLIPFILGGCKWDLDEITPPKTTQEDSCPVIIPDDRKYGVGEDFFGNSIVQAPNGNFIVIGGNDEFGPWDNDIHIVKIASNLERLDEIIYGDEQKKDSASKIILTKDNGYLIAASQEQGASNFNMWFFKTDSTLKNIAWQKNFGTISEKDYGVTIIETSNGEYLLLGKSFNEGTGDFTSKLYLVDEYGEESKNFNRVEIPGFEANSVVETIDGNFVLAGNKMFEGKQYDICLVEVDQQGNNLELSCFPKGSSIISGDLTEKASSIINTLNGGFAIIGYTTIRADSLKEEIYLLVLNRGKEVIGEYKFGGPGSDVGVSIIESSNNNFVIAGRTNREKGQELDMYFAQIQLLDNSNFNLDEKVFGFEYEDVCRQMIQTCNGGYALVGYSQVFISPMPSEARDKFLYLVTINL